MKTKHTLLAALCGLLTLVSVHTADQTPAGASALQDHRTNSFVITPAAFTASETFDVAVDLRCTVARGYFERAPFKFNGKINLVKVELK